MYGKGIVNVLNCVKLVQNPTLYASFLLWMMSELFQKLPEAGDLEKPKLVFFFDEAHLLFADAPKILVQKIEQVVKLIRSKGVGIYFVTQSPSDIPDSVLAQLSNRYSMPSGRTPRRSRKLSGQQHSPCGPILPLRQKKSSWNWA